MRRPHRTRLFGLLPVAALAFAAPRLVHAQDTTRATKRDSLPSAPAARPDDGPVCLGFAFGAWTPKLDWKAAGHTVDPATVPMGRAEGGRDWAAPPSDVAGDTALLLFPHWWPAGVSVALPTRTPAVGDTVVGRAVALVPRPDVQAPVSRVRAWRVACRGSAGR